ncbi:MAG: spore cortex biosynthesis protein YabQ [Oscillospiraceae bacterium]|nr:spore cortex biosynthesis protein YabQ [Oscillospiraceae bacterium]
MAADVSAQGWALVQALGLGLALGVLYDLLRILRVRIALPLLGGVLDLLFWVSATVVLFVWSQGAWGGRIRLYGVFGVALGGGLYFRLFSRHLLRVGYLLADVVHFLLDLALMPMRGVFFLTKKIKNYAKNTFSYGRKWYRIKTLSKEMDAVHRDRLSRMDGGGACEVQKNRFFDQARAAGPVHRAGRAPAGCAREDRKRRAGAKSAVPSGGSGQAGELPAVRRHRKQR